MTASDALALLPWIVLAATAIVVMMGIAFRRRHGLTLGLSLAGLVASLVSLYLAAPLAPRQVTPLLVVDRYSLFFFGLLVAAELVIVILLYDYLGRQEGPREELYLLSLIATLGGAVLVASTHFASFFLGLEMMSVSLYAMIAYLGPRRLSLEAGVKYLVLAAASAAFLLFGIALIYAALGTLAFNRFAAALAAVPGHAALANTSMLAAGVALVLTGIGFKMAVAPFHLWTPDVYQGAAAPVTAWISTLSKGAIVALLLRFLLSFHAAHRGILLVVSLIAIASMIVGNLLALLQDNVKRILAYSSIAHMGYLLVAVLAALRAGNPQLAIEAAAFYLVAYFLTTLAAFGVIGALSNSSGEPELVDDYRGLFWRRPAVATVFVFSLFSLAGIPATAGFIGKYYLVAAGASVAVWTPVIVLVASSVIGLFYYLRIVMTLFATPDPLPRAFSGRITPWSGVVLGVMLAGLVWLGFDPNPMIRLLHSLPPL